MLLFYNFNASTQAWIHELNLWKEECVHDWEESPIYASDFEHCGGQVCLLRIDTFILKYFRIYFLH